MFPYVERRRAGVVNESPIGGRSSRSYPVRLDLRYKIIRDGKPVHHGTGRTRQLSSTELIFSADHPLPIGTVEVAIDWPIWLDGICPLQLIVFGHVIGSDQAVSVKIVRHEFRTRRLPPRSQSTDRPESYIRSLPT